MPVYYLYITVFLLHFINDNLKGIITESTGNCSQERKQTKTSKIFLKC